MNGQKPQKKLKKFSFVYFTTCTMQPRDRLKRKLKKMKRQARIYKTGANASER